MQKIVFYPRYTIRGSADVLGISLGLIIALVFSYLKLGAIPLNFVILIVLIAFITFFSRLYIRRIVFTPSFFLVEKYVWPSIKIGYSDVIDMGIWTIKTKKGKIDLVAMTNVAQLHSLFIELMKENKVNVDQSENQALLEDLAHGPRFWPSVIISIVLFLFFVVYDYYSKSHFNQFLYLLVPVLIFSVVLFVGEWFYKRRMKDQ